MTQSGSHDPFQDTWGMGLQRHAIAIIFEAFLKKTYFAGANDENGFADFCCAVGAYVERTGAGRRSCHQGAAAAAESQFW
jgi:hypothetical protein